MSATSAKPSGSRLALSPKMSASTSFDRMIVLATGVIRKKKTENTATTSGSAARSPMPEIPQRAPQRRSAQAKPQRRKAKPATITRPSSTISS